MYIDSLLGMGFAALLAYSFYGPWQSLCSDAARHELFKGRDALFDLALKGEISFSSSQYKFLRAYLNISIRFAHRFTLGDFFCFCLFFKGPQKRDEDRLITVIESIDDESLRSKVKKIAGSATFVMIKMIILKSAWGLALVTPVILISKVARFSRLGGWAIYKHAEQTTTIIKNLAAKRVRQELTCSGF